MRLEGSTLDDGWWRGQVLRGHQDRACHRRRNGILREALARSGSGYHGIPCLGQIRLLRLQVANQLLDGCLAFVHRRGVIDMRPAPELLGQKRIEQRVQACVGQRRRRGAPRCFPFSIRRFSVSRRQG